VASPARVDATDARFDYNHFGAMRKAYIVASSPRCGGTHFCWRLWQTGRLGVPIEYFNPAVCGEMSRRLGCASPADYVAALIARRTSKNGVFALKSHFYHFEAFAAEYPGLLEALAPVSFIYISRSDKLAQAVSLAKALLTERWTSRAEASPRPALVYDRRLIERCLENIARVEAAWRQWFANREITPLEVRYEELMGDPDGVVLDIMRHLDVTDDPADRVEIPTAERQHDEINAEWTERFLRETAAPTFPRAGAGSDPSGRDDGLIARLAGTGRDTQRERHDAVFLDNRSLFRARRVLDIKCGDGQWSLAALDAGAAKVTALENSPRIAAAADRRLAESGAPAQAYEVIQFPAIFAQIAAFAPESFDIVLCRDFFPQCHHSDFFRQLHRLRPKHVFFAVRTLPRTGPFVRFALDARGAVTSEPTPEALFLLSKPGFSCRLVYWSSAETCNWANMQNFVRDRIYALERL
jgi:LPS sulfotransferase NodH/SAM-dependent methyltransferase